MPLQRNRTHLITCRLSTEEYEALKDYCASERVRSVSDFVRHTIIEKIMSLKGPGRAIHEDLYTLTVKLQQLDTALYDTRHLITGILGETNDRKTRGAAE